MRFGVVARIGSAVSENAGETMSSTPPVIFPAPSTVTLPTKVVVPQVPAGALRFPVGAVMKKTYWPFRVAFDAVPGMVTVALALLVPSVTEDAVIVTMPPDGEEAGAV